MEAKFDVYYRNKELKEVLEHWAEKHPNLFELRVIGQSYEGTDIYLAVITNKDTGVDTQKPAFWINANIHATELTGTAASLYLIHKLLSEYGENSRITSIVDDQVFYIVPRLNPDGAEKALASKDPLFLRSGTRAYPYEEKRDGFHVEDVNDDGRILQMRIPDPTGDWKVSDKDPRLMVKRDPDEEGGSYYRVFPEGTIQNYDGHIIKMAPPLQGTDFNRNFPCYWQPEGKQAGAGEYPMSEPEVLAAVKFISHHPNIYAGIDYHTFSRAILRPFNDKSDDDMDTDDLWNYQTIGKIGTRITGYPCVSVYHHFRYHPKEVVSGAFDDWLYTYRGILGLTIELWDLATASGVTGKNDENNFIEWFRNHPIEDDYKMFDFIAEHNPDGIVDWFEFEHPQLGKVELGGWDRVFTWRNPPKQLLEAEVAPQADFVISFASLAPKIHWYKVDVTSLGEGNYHILAILENTGYLPTQAANQAKTLKTVQPIRIKLGTSEKVSLKSGQKFQEIGQLEGRSNKKSTGYYANSPMDNRCKIEWVVQGSAGEKLTLDAISDRAGHCQHEIILK